MKISFVIPAYNEEHFLADCLQTIITDVKNSNADAEIIVVNNASTDRTKAVAQSFSGVMIIEESSKGLVKARQAGFMAATGDLIANIDADVRLPLGWTSKVLREFQQDPLLIGLSGPFIYHDASPLLRLLVKQYYRLAYASYLLSRHVLKISSLMQGGNFVVKRSALAAIDGFNPRFDFYGEDTDMAQRLHKVGKVKFTLQLRVYSSARRLKAEGIIGTAGRYVINYVWVILFKKPFSNKSTDIRP
jgi:glycosyltransferase involved in cell wall biosynthesis